MRRRQLGPPVYTVHRAVHPAPEDQTQFGPSMPIISVVHDEDEARRMRREHPEAQIEWFEPERSRADRDAPMATVRLGVGIREDEDPLSDPMPRAVFADAARAIRWSQQAHPEEPVSAVLEIPAGVVDWSGQGWAVLHRSEAREGRAVRYRRRRWWQLRRR